MIYFSSTNLGSSPITTTLPSAQPDGTGSRGFLLVIRRDMGASDVNYDASVTVTQNGVTLVDSLRASLNGVGSAGLAPDPAGGAISIQAAGAGKIYTLSIEDYPERL